MVTDRVVGESLANMSSSRNFFDVLWESIRAPKVSDQQLDELLSRVRSELPAPVFWLFTKVLAVNLPGITASGWI